MAGSAGISKIKIRLGQIEIDYEGAHEFLKQDLQKLLAAVVELRQKAGEPEESDETPVTPETKAKGKGKFQGTVSTFAVRLGAKSTRDLIIAAAAKLTLADGKDTFSRNELLAAMQTASNHYKKSDSSNLSKTLGVLLNGRLTENSKDTFALTADELQKLRTSLAG